MAARGTEENLALRNRLQLCFQLGLLLHLVVAVLLVCTWFVFVRRGDLGAVVRQELGTRLGDLERDLAASKQTLADLAAHQVHVLETVQLYRVELRKDRAGTGALSYSLFALGPGTATPTTPLAQGELPSSMGAEIELPAVSAAEADTLLFHTSVEIRTDNKLREERGLKNRFYLRCRDAAGQERRAALTANFFTLERQLGSESLLKGFSSGHAFSSRGSAMLALVIDTQTLAKNFYDDGVCDVLIEVGPGMAIGPAK